MVDTDVEEKEVMVADERSDNGQAENGKKSNENRLPGPSSGRGKTNVMIDRGNQSNSYGSVPVPHHGASHRSGHHYDDDDFDDSTTTGGAHHSSDRHESPVSRGSPHSRQVNSKNTKGSSGSYKSKKGKDKNHKYDKHHYDSPHDSRQTSHSDKHHDLFHNQHHEPTYDLYGYSHHDYHPLAQHNPHHDDHHHSTTHTHHNPYHPHNLHHGKDYDVHKDPSHHISPHTSHHKQHHTSHHPHGSHHDSHHSHHPHHGIGHHNPSHHTTHEDIEHSTYDESHHGSHEGVHHHPHHAATSHEHHNSPDNHHRGSDHNMLREPRHGSHHNPHLQDTHHGIHPPHAHHNLHSSHYSTHEETTRHSSMSVVHGFEQHHDHHEIWVRRPSDTGPLPRHDQPAKKGHTSHKPHHSHHTSGDGEHTIESHDDETCPCLEKIKRHPFCRCVVQHGPPGESESVDRCLCKAHHEDSMPVYTCEESRRGTHAGWATQTSEYEYEIKKKEDADLLTRPLTHVFVGRHRFVKGPPITYCIFKNARAKHENAKRKAENYDFIDQLPEIKCQLDAQCDIDKGTGVCPLIATTVGGAESLGKIKMDKHVMNSMREQKWMSLAPDCDVCVCDSDESVPCFPTKHQSVPMRKCDC